MAENTHRHTTAVGYIIKEQPHHTTIPKIE
jgi:hypothetical protein